MKTKPARTKIYCNSEKKGPRENKNNKSGLYFISYDR